MHSAVIFSLPYGWADPSQTAGFALPLVDDLQFLHADEASDWYLPVRDLTRRLIRLQRQMGDDHRAGMTSLSYFKMASQAARPA